MTQPRKAVPDGPVMGRNGRTPAENKLWAQSAALARSPEVKAETQRRAVAGRRARVAERLTEKHPALQGDALEKAVSAEISRQLVVARATSLQKRRREAQQRAQAAYDATLAEELGAGEDA